MSGRGNYFAVFLLGVGAGVAATYKYFKEKYRMKEEEEVESVKNYWKKLYGKDENKEKRGSGNKETNKKEETPVNSKSSLDYKAKEKPTDRPRPKYNTYAKKMDSAESEFPREEDEDTTKTTSNAVEPDIYEIGFDEYFANNGYAKTQLNYYTYNRVVTSEKERDEDDPEVVDDYHVLLGYVLEQSGYMDDNNITSIYIRNDQLSADYEVNKLFAQYA